MPKKIIIDTDPGVDDAMAILLAFQSPEVEVVGLTTVFGNVYTSQATQNALRLVELANRPDIPVAHGAELPLVVPLESVADFVHGADGLGNTNLPPPPGQPIDRRQFFPREAKRDQQDLDHARSHHPENRFR